MMLRIPTGEDISKIVESPLPFDSWCFVTLPDELKRVKLFIESYGDAPLHIGENCGLVVRLLKILRCYY